MPEALPPKNESKRLHALNKLNILDSPHEAVYDDIARLAAEVCGTPIGLISLVDKDRQWFKANFGIDSRETPRSQAFCAHAIHNPKDPLVVTNAQLDPRFADNPLVNGAPHIRFYAGVPLVTALEKMPIGTLCVISDQVMTIDQGKLKTLSLLASHVEKLIEIRESNFELQQRDLLIDASRDAIVSWTSIEGILRWNSGAEKLYGYSSQEAKGRTPSQLLQTTGAASDEIAESLSDGQDWVGELKQQTKSGETVWVSTRLQRVTIGQTSVILETSRDITDHRFRTRALERAQRALDTSHEAIFWVRQDTTIAYANQAACERLQYSQQELQSMTISDIDPDMRSLDALEMRKTQVNEQKKDLFQTIHQRKNGTLIPVEISSSMIEFDDEEFFCTFVRDITARLARQQLLETRTAELQLFFDALPLAAITADIERRITRVNPAFADMFGYDAKDLVGQSTEKLYSKLEDFSVQLNQRFNAYAPSHLAPYEVDYRRSNGETFTSETIGAKVSNSSGEPLGFLALIQDISDRVEAREKLERLNEDRRAMVELLGTTDGVWSWDVGSDLCEYAPGYRKLLGFEGDDLTQFPNTARAFLDRLHPDDRDSLEASVQRSLLNRQPLVAEFRVRHQNESYIWVRARSNSIYTDDGEPIKMVGSIYDITEMKQADFEKESFFNAGIQLYGIADLEKVTWYRLSSHWVDVLGYPIEELMQKQFLDLTHPDDRGAFEDCMKLLLSGTPVRGFLGRMQHRDGAYRWINWNGAPAQKGESTIYFTASDVTDADHDVLTKIADAVPMTLYVFDIQQKASVFVNRHVKSLLGYTAEQVMELGSNLFETLVHPDDHLRLMDHFGLISSGSDEDRFEFDCRIKQLSGDYRQVYSTNRVFKRSPDGNVQQIIGTATPLDDLAILRRYANELERANEDLEQFAYIASHDLKQPLRGIDNLAKWITSDSGDSLPAVAQRHLDKLRGRVVRMERLLDDLLAYSRVGRQPSEKETVDTRHLIEEVADLLAAPLDFRIECEGSMPVFETQRVPLEQVFRNLIGNAIKHGDRVDGCVTVSAKTVDSFIEFSIADNGPGIAAEYHDRVFRMFHTLRPRDEVEASGMGLALVKKEVELRDGSVTLQSEPGHGAVFRFTWPM
ncbi:PAS domain S-box protein [Planctomycetes bacterium K23_9]|uniref:histidine kinase n=1 Tax=Stieleria marina TaxID=1930275 RepID=A0A517NUS5_9BACT|nr:Phytochrome-like protein cph1 [Planctomycetes bacterium K23_9]